MSKYEVKKKKDHMLKDEGTPEMFNDDENVDTGSESELTVGSQLQLANQLKMINNQLDVIEPSSPLMEKFQNVLTQHLLKQKNNIKQELLSLEESIKSKQNEKSQSIHDEKNLQSRVKTQHSLLSEFHRMKIELEKTNKLVATGIKQGKQRFNEILKKTSIETKKLGDLKRQLDCSRGLLNELKKYGKEQEITINKCNQKKFQTQQYKKKLLNDQQKQDILLLSLTQEILRFEDRIKLLGEQAETKYNERQLLKQKVMDSSTDLDAINEDNTKITLSWNEVLINIQQSDISFQKIKNDLQEAQNKYHILQMESNSYKRSGKDELHKNYDLDNLLNKLKREQHNLQNNLKACLNTYNGLKEEFSKLIQITEFQQQNLNEVLIDQKSIKNEINTLLNLLDKITNQKLRYDEDIFDEIKKKLFSNNNCVHINNKISQLKVQNKDHELMLVGLENSLTQALLKVDEYRTTSFNVEKDIEEITKCINNKKFTLSVIDSELKKLLFDSQNKSRQIDIENKQLETLRKKCEDGYIMTPQMQIDQVKHNIDKIRKESYIIKQTWVQKQTKNLQFLDQRNKQLNELNNVRKYILAMDIKKVKLEIEIVSLSEEVEQEKRVLTNIKNTILKLNNSFNQNKGKSSQLLNENEWIQCSYLAELKENEKQILEYIDSLKLLKNQLNELKNVYIDKQLESKSWDTKIQLLIEMKNEMKNKEGDVGDIESLKKEIHRMEIREGQLKKIIEKIMSDLEVCISRREMIYNKVAAKDTRLKGKNETKQNFLKKMDNLRINIKKIKIECKKLDRNICELSHSKMELESKLIYLTDKLELVQKKNNDLIRIIDDTETKKNLNLYNLIYKQTYVKFFEEVKKGKYRLLIKNESKMNEEFAAERKKNLDLISVVEALKKDFPDLDIQITRSLYMLKSD